MSIDRNKAVPDAYQGREQSLIKHRLLQGYLEKLFHIIGMSSRRLGITEICYVDCFAGPWESETADLADTSIGISLKALESCREKLGKLDIRVRIRALYIEKDAKRFARLKQFIDSRPSGSVEAKYLHDDFLAVQEKILDWCGSRSFCFFFIDPTGWKEVGIAALKPLLKRRQSEFLINFMYDFINRTMSMPDWGEDTEALLGTSLDVEGLEPDEREEAIIDTYRQNLKTTMFGDARMPARSAYVRVLEPAEERPKYHLVYLTSHPRGIIEFMEISEDIDLIQKQVRASVKQSARASRTGMNDMFSDDLYVEKKDGHIPQYWVENYLLTYLSSEPKRVDEGEFALILETTNLFPGDFQLALKSLIEAGKVRNLDARRKRPKNPLHWQNGGERLALVEKKK